MSESNINEVEIMKSVLMARATGGTANDVEYKSLRKSLLQNDYLKNKLPRFLRNCRSLDEYWGHIKEVSPNYQGRRDYLRNEFLEVLNYLEEMDLIESPLDEIVSNTLTHKDGYAYVKENWDKALSSRNDDPERAISMARTLIESTCKHILDHANEPYKDSADLPQLYKSVQKVLNLAPSEHTEEVFKQILGGCVSIVNGLGSVRNQLGDAHGKGIKVYKPSSRHAVMAVNMAGAMTEFLISTWEERLDKE
ncbi:abortive infection family protein [Sporosarcina sp. FA9]|uniref:abortive infection family protein n=1 Tax=Sporosarcina sp. FA9 TaxID=3413030 RepID=UPI003F65C2A5